MIIIPRRKKHIYIRPKIMYKKPLYSLDLPLENIEKLLTTGKWIPDDGRPGLAFIGESYGTPFAWYGRCKCSIPRGNHCPHTLAMNYCCQKYYAANGVEVKEFKKEKE